MIDAVEPTPDQARYARLLSIGTHTGFVLLVVLFGVYMLGIVQPQVPHERLPELWKLPARQFLEQAGIAGGWGWTALLNRADILTLVGIAFLSLCSLPCLLAVMPIYWANGERKLFAICVLEVIVILVAASGLLGSGR